MTDENADRTRAVLRLGEVLAADEVNIYEALVRSAGLYVHVVETSNPHCDRRVERLVREHLRWHARVFGAWAIAPREEWAAIMRDQAVLQLEDVQ